MKTDERWREEVDNSAVEHRDLEEWKDSNCKHFTQNGARSMEALPMLHSRSTSYTTVQPLALHERNRWTLFAQNCIWKFLFLDINKDYDRWEATGGMSEWNLRYAITIRSSSLL